ncbi:MAG: hypothetical protein ACE5OS_12505 [Anaerolineae bacterium]
MNTAIRKRTIATVVQVTGTCNAGYQIGDRVIINHDTACIDKEQSDTLCIWALNAVLANMCRIRPREKALASCPDPATGLGGNVTFSVVMEEYRDEGIGKPD